MEGFQAAYRIPSGRPFLKQRAMAIFLVLIAAIPSVGASSHPDFRQPDRGLVDPLDRRLRYQRAGGTGLAVRPLGAGILYHNLGYRVALLFRPESPALNRDYVTKVIASRFMRVWPGAFVATVLWLIATAGFAWYVSHLANYNIFYGSVGTVVVLLIWLYLMACISLIGCEFNAERERAGLVAIPD